MRAEFDYGMIIWVIFFILTFIVSGIEKRKNARKKTNEQHQFPPVTADFPPVATKPHSPSQDTAAGRKRPNFTMHKDSQESLNLPETLGRPESLERTATENRFFSTYTNNPTDRTPHRGRKNNATKQSKPTTEAAEDKVTATENRNEDVSDRFNLRDAVIYSEILKPKFDE